MRHQFSSWLRRLAARIDGKIFVEFVMPKSISTKPGRQMAIAKEMIGTMELRAALRRYSPEEKPGQC